jgi:hypothetical protein
MRIFPTAPRTNKLILYTGLARVRIVGAPAKSLLFVNIQAIILSFNFVENPNHQIRVEVGFYLRGIVLHGKQMKSIQERFEASQNFRGFPKCIFRSTKKYFTQ